MQTKIDCDYKQNEFLFNGKAISKILAHDASNHK